MEKLPEIPKSDGILESQPLTEAQAKEIKKEQSELNNDVFGVMLAYLNPKEQLDMRTVNKEWREKVKNNFRVITDKQRELIDNMTNIVAKTLDKDKYSKEIALFKEFNEKNKISEKTTAAEIGKSLLNMRDIMAASMKRMDGDALNSLKVAFEAAEMPKFFKILPELALSLQYYDRNDGNLAKCYNLFNSFLNMGLLSRAYELAMQEKEFNTIEHMANAFAERGEVDKTLQVISKLPHPQLGQDIIKKLAVVLLERGRVEEAIPLIDKMHSGEPKEKAKVVGAISTYYIEHGSVDKSLEILKKMPKLTTTDKIHGIVDRIDRSVGIVKGVVPHDQGIQEEINRNYEKVVNALLEKGLPKEAREIAQKIIGKQPKEKAELLAKISKAEKKID